MIVYKLLFILGMPDFSNMPSTTLFFLDGEQRISNLLHSGVEPDSFVTTNVPMPSDPCSPFFSAFAEATNSILVPASPVRNPALYHTQGWTVCHNRSFNISGRLTLIKDIKCYLNAAYSENCFPGRNLTISPLQIAGSAKPKYHNCSG